MSWQLNKYMNNIKRYDTMHDFLEKKIVQMIFWLKGPYKVKAH